MVQTTDAIAFTFIAIIGITSLVIGSTAVMPGTQVRGLVCDQPQPVRNTLEALPTVSECVITDDPSVQPTDVYRLTHGIKIDPATGIEGAIRDNSFVYKTEKMQDAEPQFSFLSSNLAFFTAERYKVEYQLINDNTGRILTTDAKTFTDQAITGTEFKQVTFTTPGLPDGRYRLKYTAKLYNEGLLDTEVSTDTLTAVFIVPGQEGVIE